MIYTKLYYILIIAVLYTSCGLYSFSGASIAEEVNTVCINYIQNEAKLIEPNLANKFTEALITKCQTETNLATVSNTADINFSGRIVQYEVEPIAIQKNETAAQNRLTISVEISYINQINESENFKQTFVDYADFDSNQNFSNIEETLNNIIIANLIDQVFNKAFMNW